jgi:heme O synthase-like polyprenyltransferase
MNWRSDNPGANAVSLRNNTGLQRLTRLADYRTLTKPEVNFLVLASTLAGFYLASRGPLGFGCLFHTLMGTLLVASGKLWCSALGLYTMACALLFTGRTHWRGAWCLPPSFTCPWYSP